MIQVLVFSDSRNFHKLKMEDLISGATNFVENQNYLVTTSAFQFYKFEGLKFISIH